MSSFENARVRRLMQAFMQFNKAVWHDRMIAGYKPSEMKLLIILKHSSKLGSEGMRVSEISKRLRVTSPTVTQLINGLEEKGLVVRSVDPSDRRVVRIQLSPQGNDVACKAKEAFADTFNGLIEYLGDEQSDQLAQLLTKAFEYFSEETKQMHEVNWNGDEHE